MPKRIPREEDGVGRVTVSNTGHFGGVMRVPLGRRRGVLWIQVTQEGDHRNAAQLYIRWLDRPGAHSPGGLVSNDYLTHVLLALDTGDIYPGYQSGDPATEAILHPNRKDADVEGEAVDEDDRPSYPELTS